MFADTSNFTSNKMFFSIKDMTLHGNKDYNTAGNGINLQPSGTGHYWDFFIENVFVKQFAETGVILNDAHGVWIMNSPIEYNDNHGLQITGGGGATIIGCTIKGNTNHGIRLTGSYNIMITGNLISNNGANGIYGASKSMIFGNDIASNGGDGIQTDYNDYNIICGNVIHDNSAYGVDVISTSKENRIVSNIFYGNSLGAINYASTTTVIKFNYGYTTENSGTYEAVGDGTTVNFSIAHGCDATPTNIQITPANETMSNCSYYVDTYIDSTNFYMGKMQNSTGKRELIKIDMHETLKNNQEHMRFPYIIS